LQCSICNEVYINVSFYQTVAFKGRIQTPSLVPSLAKLLLPRIFTNFLDSGTERDKTKELEMNSIGICSIYRLNRMLFLSYLSQFSS